jgi:hypothetical protein
MKPKVFVFIGTLAVLAGAFFIGIRKYVIKRKHAVVK